MVLFDALPTQLSQYLVRATKDPSRLDANSKQRFKKDPKVQIER
jgi:hypothetical protein